MKNKGLVSIAEVSWVMSNQNTDFFSQKSFDGFVKQVGLDMRVNRTQRIVQKVNVCVDVEATGQVYSSFLTTTEGNTSLPNDRRVSMW